MPEVLVQGGDVKLARGVKRTAQILKKTEAAKARLLEARRTADYLTEACKIAGVGLRTVYDWKESDEAFALAYDAAKEQADEVYLEELRKEVKRRGLYGVEEPVIFGGKPRMVKDPVTGKMIPLTVRRFSDNLLMFEVKRRDPAYRDSYPALDVRFQGPTSVSIVLDTTPKSSHPATDGESKSRVIDVTPEKPEEDGGLPDLSVEE
jgi:hypothetical protein